MEKNSVTGFISTTMCWYCEEKNNFCSTQVSTKNCEYILGIFFIEILNMKLGNMFSKFKLVAICLKFQICSSIHLLQPYICPFECITVHNL